MLSLYNKPKKIIILLLFLLATKLWCEPTFYWDIGGFSAGAVFNTNNFSPELKVQIGDLYLISEKTHLCFEVKPLILNLSLIQNENMNSDIPQRDLTGLTFVNFTGSWNPLMTENFWLGGYITLEYLNPFDITRIKFHTGLEFAIILPLYFSESVFSNILPKILTLDTGLLLDSKNSFRPSGYVNICLNFGFFFSMLAEKIQN